MRTVTLSLFRANARAQMVGALRDTARARNLEHAQFWAMRVRYWLLVLDCCNDLA